MSVSWWCHFLECISPIDEIIFRKQELLYCLLHRFYTFVQLIIHLIKKILFFHCRMLTDIFDYNEVQVLWHNSVKKSQYFNIWCFLSSRWPSFGSREIQMVRQHRWFNMYISVLKTTLANMQYFFTYFIWNGTCDHIPYEQQMYNYSGLSMEAGR